ncbi:hypothetical protein BJ742DRAFT_218935 [Cladochytrium replicatum]|nr:hypothetical protein BJ742DRAFT_218935 [Cladochytrium replicatum]
MKYSCCVWNWVWKGAIFWIPKRFVLARCWTFIALMMMNFHELDAQHKRQRISVFIVPVVHLVIQQSQYSAHSSLRVTHYFGDIGVDSWTIKDWRAKIDGSDLMVMTGIFSRSYFESPILLSKRSRSSFDECHHTRGELPYNQIMQDYGCCHRDERPRVLGLSASPSKQNTRLSIKYVLLRRRRSRSIPDHRLIRNFG